jgi:hypothetical protein
MFAKWARDFQRHSNQLPLFDQKLSDSVGGDPNIRYYHSHWALAEDEALVGRTGQRCLDQKRRGRDVPPPINPLPSPSLPRSSTHRRHPAEHGTFKSTTTGWNPLTIAITVFM